MVNRRTRRGHRGLTLLELMLALSLTAMIMAVIAMSLDIYMRTLDRRQAITEEAQLARAILNQIATDLRSAVQYAEPDAEEGLAGLDGVDVMGAASDLLGGGALGDDLLGAVTGGDDPTITDMLDDEATTTDLATSTIPPAVPGLYGNMNQLQLDISRLPRVEEYQRVMALEENFALTDIPSDVKTITYYVQSLDAPELEEGDVLEDDIMKASGLVRRQMDRAVTTFAADNGNADDLMNLGDVIAPEVVGLEFQYWDGIQWLPEWDTELNEGLPVAVEVRLYMRSNRSNQSSSLLSAFSFNEQDDMDSEQGVSVYRLVVRLPVGKFNMDTDTANPLESLGL